MAASSISGSARGEDSSRAGSDCSAGGTGPGARGTGPGAPASAEAAWWHNELADSRVLSARGVIEHGPTSNDPSFFPLSTHLIIKSFLFCSFLGALGSESRVARTCQASRRGSCSSFERILFYTNCG